MSRFKPAHILSYKLHIFFKKIIEKSKYFKNINIDENYISFIHGRESCIKIKKDKWLSIKGCGWQIGPPTVYYSKKDPLYFGILDTGRAKREFQVSKHLNSKFKNVFAKCVDIVEYDVSKIQNEFKIKLPKSYLPCVLIRIVKSPYRLEDIAIMHKKNFAKVSFQKKFGFGYSGIVKFQKKLLNNILKYHSIGCVNDTLEWNNITTYGEIIDLELFHHPKIYSRKSITKINSNLKFRIEKEVIYFIEIIYRLGEILGFNLTLKDISESSYNMITKKNKDLSFSKILLKISKMK